MTRYTKIIAPHGKFADRFVATHENGVHKMACCDCGLVHDMKFTAWLRVPGGYRKLSGRAAVVMIQAKRNERATAAKRRKKQVCVERKRRST